MKVRTDQGTYWRWEQGATPEEYFQVRLAELFGVERSELGFDR